MDMKYEIQVMAEELAQEKYGLDYDDLPMEVKDCIYEDAMENWTNNKVGEAEALNDALKENLYEVN